MLTRLVSQWAYLGIAVGTFIEGEAVLLLAGAAARAGQLYLPLVVLAAMAGSLTWGQTWFYVGRKFGRPFIDRRAHWHERAARVDRWLSRYGGWVVIAFRFLAGMAIVLPVLIGACGFHPRRFLFLDGIGALVWASLFASAGFGMSAGLMAVLQRPIGWQEIVGIAVLGAVLIWLVTRVVNCLLSSARSGDAAS
jgi:membrane protein DedA with SNARE-associated domain